MIEELQKRIKTYRYHTLKILPQNLSPTTVCLVDNATAAASIHYKYSTENNRN